MKESTYTLALSALFVALVLLLGLTPLGIIPLGFISVTILCVPVVIGTILLGVRIGLLLGGFFGFASALSAFGLSLTPPSALAGALVASSPALAIVLCLLPRLCVPLAAYGVYRLFARDTAHSIKAVAPAAVAGSLTNTVLYLGLMRAFYSMVSLDDTLLQRVILGTGLIAGGSEAVVCALIATPVVAALWKVQQKRNG